MLTVTHRFSGHPALKIVEQMEPPCVISKKTDGVYVFKLHHDQLKCVSVSFTQQLASDRHCIAFTCLSVSQILRTLNAVAST